MKGQSFSLVLYKRERKETKSGKTKSEVENYLKWFDHNLFFFSLSTS